MKDEIKECYADYLKTIYLISKRNKGGWVANSDIAEHLEIKPSSVTIMLRKLNKRGLVNWKPRQKIRLTENGREIAQKTLGYYLSLKLFFKDILKLEDNIILDRICCKMEHHLTPDISRALIKFTNEIS